MIHLTMLPLDSREIVQNVFSPMVGVLSSQLAAEMCGRNNLTFVEMLQPFTRLSTDAYFHDAAGGSNSIKGTRINVCDIGWQPPQTMLARKLLTESVASAQADAWRTIELPDLAAGGSAATLRVPARQPWFEQWRETFLSVQPPADHEYTRHLLGCLVVLASADPTPLDTAQQLTHQLHAMQTQSASAPAKVPRWFGGGEQTLVCYVMLHDAQTDMARVQQSYESLKLTYGENRCFLLQINSLAASAVATTGADANTADLWAKYLRRRHQHQTHSQPASGSHSDDNASSVTARNAGTETGLRYGHGASAAVGSSPLETPPTSIQLMNEEVVDHPLSPVQENAVEAIHSSMSTSCESLSTPAASAPHLAAHHHLNPNVWAGSVHDGTTATADDCQLHGQHLAHADLKNLEHFIQDYTIRSLIPHVERLCAHLHDAVTNKKGRSILSVTKRWFVTNKPAAATGSAASAAPAVQYAADSAELQTRKLADLYFMFGNYRQAFEHYHQAKRDFSADSAWPLYAGALEMAALAAFMSGTATRKTYDYMEEAITTYLNYCRLPALATRATLLSAECLRAARQETEACKQLIRMTSEDSDLRSALLLEQAAYGFLGAGGGGGGPPLHRKYAFHVVLAGHRYAKAGQRRHAFRCYRQAAEVFEGRGWSLAEDHIQYTIGKQAVQLKRLDEASAALAHLLRPSSLQSSMQQTAFLREYLATQRAFVQQQQGGGGGGGAQVFDVPLPKIVARATRVLVAAHGPLAVPGLEAASSICIDSNLQDEWKWQKLEEIVVQVASKRPIMIFKPTRALFTAELPTTEPPLAVHGEPIDVSFTLENTIKPPITFEDVQLLWTFRPDDAAEPAIDNVALFGTADVPAATRAAIDACVRPSSIRSVQLNDGDRRPLLIRLIPLRCGRLSIDGVVGRLSVTNEPNSLWGRLRFEQLEIRKEAHASATAAAAAAAPSSAQPPQQQQQQQQQLLDQKLRIDVLPAVPALHVQFSALPAEVLAGECLPVQVRLTNAGASALGEIWAATDQPRWVLGADESELPLSVLKDFRDLTNEALIRDKEARRQHSFCLLRVPPGQPHAIGPHETRTATLHLQAPLRKGADTIRLLLHYAIADGPSARIRYRLVRHTWQLNVNESLALTLSANVGNLRTGELAVDVQVSNLNQVHHPLMTEIVPLELHAFCGRYRLEQRVKPVLLHGPGVRGERTPGAAGTAEMVGLRTMESLALRVALSEREDASERPADAAAFVCQRLSHVVLEADADAASASPAFDRLASFLMKHETKYIGQLGETGNTEVFNQIVTDADRHATFALTWRALVNDNASQQRVARGQHFVQLRKLYESVSCPPRDKVLQPFVGTEPELFDLFDYRGAIDVRPWTEEADDWEDNDVSVARRCFLEVEEDKSGAVDELTQHTAMLGIAQQA